jgi:hypothetical protein
MLGAPRMLPILIVAAGVARSTAGAAMAGQDGLGKDIAPGDHHVAATARS